MTLRSRDNIIPVRLELFSRSIGNTMGHITNRLNSLKDLFRTNNVVTPPTDAAYNALSPGYTTMELRRTFGSKSRAFSAGLIRARATNPAPTVANALVDQNVNEGAALSYQFAANTFADADSQTLTYTAALAAGGALPGWITFTAGTRTFSGTAPAVTENTPITVRVTATDPFGASVYDDFVITVVNV